MLPFFFFHYKQADATTSASAFLLNLTYIAFTPGALLDIIFFIPNNTSANVGFTLSSGISGLDGS